MKKRILTTLLIVASCLLNFGQKKTNSTTTNSNSPSKVEKMSKKDTILFEYMDTYVSQLRDPQYEIYPTTNTWNFLKLNTRTGQITIVQFSVESDSNRMEYSLNDNSLLRYNDEEICGRFKLIPTKNHWNFLLLDQIDGRVWQVQWSFEKANRFVTRIY